MEKSFITSGPGAAFYGFLLPSLLENIVMRNGQMTSLLKAFGLLKPKFMYSFQGSG